MCWQESLQRKPVLSGEYLLGVVAPCLGRSRKCREHSYAGTRSRLILLWCTMSQHSPQQLAQRDIEVRHSNTNNEERRLGDLRGSDTLVVPFVTANDGLSINIYPMVASEVFICY